MAKSEFYLVADSMKDGLSYREVLEFLELHKPEEVPGPGWWPKLTARVGMHGQVQKLSITKEGQQ